jgi:hypothetical protein
MHDISGHTASYAGISRIARKCRSARLALAVISPGLLPALATAQPDYPRVVELGENSTIDYGPGPLGNIVGGGRVVVSGSGSREDTVLTHLDPHYAQRPPVGLVPVLVGSGEGAVTIWVPATTDGPQQALIGEDGAMPGTMPTGRPLGSASR